MHGIKPDSLLVCALLACSLPLSAAEQHQHEEEHEEHGAHVHGEAQLLIAAEENRLEIEFLSPAMNIIGFEHKPADKAQAQALESALETLNRPELLFGLPAAAKCTSASVEVDSPLVEHSGEEHEETHEDAHEHEEESHSDFTGHYAYLCQEMGRLDSIEIKLFRQFPGTEAIEVQSITAMGQQKMELTPDRNTLKF